MKPTKVIIDYSVLAYKLVHCLEPLLSLDAFTKATDEKAKSLLASVVRAQMYYVASLSFMGNDKPDEAHIIYVMDNKRNGNYWRHSYLLRKDVTAARECRQTQGYEEAVIRHAEIKANKVDDGTKSPRKPSKPKAAKPIIYKAGRKEHTQFHTLVRREMKAVIDSEPSWSCVSVPGYEADDLAATFVKMRTDEHIWLLTMDTDWLGLINDNVGWWCIYGYYPRVRKSLEDVNIWATKRLKTTFDDPKELWAYKALHGDESDKLPAFSPIEVIDQIGRASCRERV